MSEGNVLKGKVKPAHRTWRLQSKPKLGKDDRKCPLESPLQTLESLDAFLSCQVCGSLTPVLDNSPGQHGRPASGFYCCVGKCVLGPWRFLPLFLNPAAPIMEPSQDRRAVHAANRSILTDSANTYRLFRTMYPEV